MEYEIKQRKSDGCWCIYSAKFNIVIAEFVFGIPQVTIDELERRLTSRSNRATEVCVCQPMGNDIINVNPLCPIHGIKPPPA